MPTKKNNATRQAAHVAAFINSPLTPHVFKRALQVFIAHATSATKIKIVVGKNCDTMSQPRLAQFIGRAERDDLDYDEGGLFHGDPQGEGGYVIKPDSSYLIKTQTSVRKGDAEK
jgi:hypothetical protein